MRCARMQFAVSLLVLTLVAQGWPGDNGAQSAQVVPGSQETLRIEDLVTIALRQNPSIQAAAHRVEASRRRIPQAKSLPDPMLSVGWAGNPAPFSIQTGDPSSSRSLVASQQLPYPGKLALRGDVARRESEAVGWDLEQARRNVATDLKGAFYELFFAERALQIAAKNKDLLDKLEQIAEARYRVGKAIQQDVLRSQVELSSLDQRIAMLEQQKISAQARINTLGQKTMANSTPVVLAS